MDKIVLFNKPYGVLSQFRVSEGETGVGGFIADPSLRIAGRLDSDSEGLLVLTNHGAINHYITSPSNQTYKTYCVQVEGAITDTAINSLTKGVLLKDGMTLPAKAAAIDTPSWLWPRDPPVRYRASIPTSWLQISICEGKNRQIRRMTAAVGFPTLRLIRSAVLGLTIDNLNIGQGSYITLPSSHTSRLLAAIDKKPKNR